MFRNDRNRKIDVEKGRTGEERFNKVELIQ